MQNQQLNYSDNVNISSGRSIVFDQLNFIEFSNEFFNSSFNTSDIQVIRRAMSKNPSHDLVMLDSMCILKDIVINILKKIIEFGITDEGVKNLCSILKTNKTVRSLILTNNNISNEGAKYLGQWLSENTMIKTCILMEKIGLSGLKYLSNGLVKNKSLESFCIISEQINDDCAMYIAKIINKCTNLTSVSIRSEQITERGAKHISEGILDNYNLLEMDYCGHTGSPAIASLLRKLKKLTKFRLYGYFNTPIEKSSTIISSIQKYGQSLEEILIRDNYIDIEALCNVLKSRSNLLSLDLRNSCIIDEDVQYIGELIKENDSLLKLNVSNNNISDRGAQFITEALQYNYSITEIDLTGM
jgi:hypothetical protein